MLTIRPSSICLVRALAISTGWIWRLKARPKTPSTSDSILFSMFLRMPKRYLPSHPRNEVPQHRVHYRREAEGNHSVGEGPRGLGDRERVAEQPAPRRHGEPDEGTPGPLPERDREPHRRPQHEQEQEGGVLSLDVLQDRSHPRHEVRDVQRSRYPVEGDAGVGDPGVVEREVVADENERPEGRREGRPEGAHEGAEEDRQPRSQADEGERHDEHGPERGAADVPVDGAYPRGPEGTDRRHEQREPEPDAVAHERHRERDYHSQGREARQQVARHPEARCYPQRRGAVAAQEARGEDEAQVAGREAVDQAQRALREPQGHLLGLAPGRYVARRRLAPGKELQGRPGALGAVR